MIQEYETESVSRISVSTIQSGILEKCQYHFNTIS